MQGTRISFVGFGEAGQAMAKGWANDSGAGELGAFDLRAFDIWGPALQNAATALGVALHDAPAALQDATIVFCLVTADQALVAAQNAAPHLPKGAFWMDGNSAAPDTKRRACAVMDAVGVRYVDMAIMAPIHPRLHKTPALLSGPYAQDAMAALAALDMNLRFVGPKVGDASAIKMLRSVMIKGFEALSAECILAARRAGVEDAVLDSLQGSDPAWDWRARMAYNLERMMVHGPRRAAEMREVSATLRDLGLPDLMASATATWQDHIGALHLMGGVDDLTDRSDRILTALT